MFIDGHGNLLALATAMATLQKMALEAPKDIVTLSEYSMMKRQVQNLPFQQI